MNDDAEYLDPYRRAIATHGDHFAATLWKSPEAQRLRFEIMVEMVGRERLASMVVVDIGCGRGDLAIYFNEVGVQPARFIGIDALQPMIDAASNRAGELGFPTEFQLLDILDRPNELAALKPDLCLASGTLNAMPIEVAERVVEAMVDSGAQTTCFNFLSNRVSEDRKGEDTGPSTRFDPLRMLELAFEYSPRVCFRQDYLNGHDGTVLIQSG